jgi:hypothetical protein
VPTTPARCRSKPPTVARLYRHLATDLQQGSYLTPDFHVAHELHKLIDQTPPTENASKSVPRELP